MADAGEEWIGGRELPPAVRLLGFTLVHIDAEQGTAEAGFEARAEFGNSMGNIQGGFLAAMLDAAMGTALASTLAAGQLAPTLELKISYLRPARVGRLTGRGRVVHRGGSIAFLDGTLADAAGALLATATSTVRINAAR